MARSYGMLLSGSRPNFYKETKTRGITCNEGDNRISTRGLSWPATKVTIISNKLNQAVETGLNNTAVYECKETM